VADHITRQALINVPIISAGCNITAGAYNQNIDKRLARNMIWLREISDVMNRSGLRHLCAK